MTLQSSQRLPELLFYTKKSYKILQSSNSSSNPTRAHSREFSIQNPILHAEDKELFEYYSPVSRNSTHRRQGDLLEMHPCVYMTFQATPVAPETFRTFQSFMTFQPFQAILQCSSISRESTPFQHSPIRMYILHILQFLQFDWFPQKTSPSTSWAITDITNVHSFILQRKGDVVISVKRASVKMSR